MDCLVEEIYIKHNIHDENYNEDYFFTCFENAKNYLKNKGLKVRYSSWDSIEGKCGIVEGYKHERSKFIYKSSYGMTTDIYMLPIGTKFEVKNGCWEGEIVEINGEKYLDVCNGYKVEKLDSEKDYGLAIHIY